MDTAPQTQTENDSDEIVYTQSRSASSSTRPSRAASRERGDIFRTIDEDKVADFAPFDANKHRARGNELERMVYKVASKRCSVEELQGLELDLQKWLDKEKTVGESENQVRLQCRTARLPLTNIFAFQQRTALHLSHMLIKAILANHHMFTENIRVQEGAKAKLREQLLDSNLIREKLESELIAQRGNVKGLRSELQKMKGGATPTRRQSVSAAPSSMSAPTSPDGYFQFAGPTAYPMLSATTSTGSSSASSSGRTTPTAGLAYSPLSFPGSNGSSSASTAAQRATSPTPAPRYHHSRTTSLMHRPTTPAVLQHAASSAASSVSSRRAVTPGPGHHRSASVAPGATPPVPQLPRAMTPAIHSHARSQTSTTSSHPNGLSVGANAGPGAGGSSIPPIPVPVSQLSHSMNSVGSTSGKSMRDSDSISISPGGHPRPPVPPKPRTLSQSTGAQIVSSARGGRGVVDDRDGYMTEAGERKEKEKEKRKSSRHERWLPSMLADRIGRPQTSLN